MGPAGLNIFPSRHTTGMILIMKGLMGLDGRRMNSPKDVLEVITSLKNCGMVDENWAKRSGCKLVRLNRGGNVCLPWKLNSW